MITKVMVDMSRRNTAPHMKPEECTTFVFLPIMRFGTMGQGNSGQGRMIRQEAKGTTMNCEP